jgi:hypothetical protein
MATQWTTGDNFSMQIDFGLGAGFVQLPRQTMFSSQQVASKTSVDAFTTGMQDQVTHKQWTGDFSFARTDGTADAWSNALQAAFQGGTQIALATIDVQITESTGALTNYQYPNATLMRGKESVSPGKEVMENFTWSAPLRVAQ